MDKPIAVGDLVQIIFPRHCCPHPKAHLGKIFTVSGFRNIGPIPCRDCGDRATQVNALDGDGGVGYDIRRLKRIPPLEELEGERTVEAITLPGQRSRDPA